MSLDWLSKLATFQYFHRLHATGIASALVAHLRVQLRPLGQYLADHT